jgi:hypothetical protein
MSHEVGNFADKSGATRFLPHSKKKVSDVLVLYLSAQEALHASAKAYRDNGVCIGHLDYCAVRSSRR